MNVEVLSPGVVVSSGVGSHPGVDIRAALECVFDELGLPYVPELPARGPGADMLGRTAGLLVDMPVELYAARWQLASRGGIDARRTADLWERDLDALTEVASGYEGLLKVQAAGPWTLAAGLQLPIGGVVLRDAGAVRDLVDSLTEGVRAHIAQVRARVPGAQVWLQLDEPSLPAVLGGQIRTESGLGTVRSVEASEVTQALQRLIRGVDAPVVVHCCAPNVPIALLREAGAAGMAIDLSLVNDLDALGEAVDNGFTLFAGAVPTNAQEPVSSAAIAERISSLWNKLGFPLKDVHRLVTVTPACGLAGATPDSARAILRGCRDAARRLSEMD